MQQLEPVITKEATSQRLFRASMARRTGAKNRRRNGNYVEDFSRGATKPDEAINRRDVGQVMKGVRRMPRR